jgi:hypothetical protein
MPVSPIDAEKAEKSLGVEGLHADLESPGEVTEYPAVSAQPARALRDGQRRRPIAHAGRIRLSSHPPVKAAGLDQRPRTWLW